MIACDRDRCLCQYGQPSNTYQRDGWDWPHGDEDDVAERISDRFAVLPDGLLLRLTPSGQPTVDEVLQPGTLIHASYHHEGRAFKVFRVREREYYGGIPAYTIALGDVGQEAREDGMPKNYLAVARKPRPLGRGGIAFVRVSTRPTTPPRCPTISPPGATSPSR